MPHPQRRGADRTVPCNIASADGVGSCPDDHAEYTRDPGGDPAADPSSNALHDIPC
jgi:hypothetical protein